jgi:hypothetical protein
MLKVLRNDRLPWYSLPAHVANDTLVTPPSQSRGLPLFHDSLPQPCLRNIELHRLEMPIEL